MPLSHLPIQRRLVAIILFTTLAALVGSYLVLLAYETKRSQQTTVQALDTLSGIIASNSTAALVFGDTGLANEILSGLHTDPNVTEAALFDRDGHLVASYPSTLSANQVSAIPSVDGARFSLREYEMRRGVTQGNTRVGSLYVRSDLGEMYRRLGVYLWVLGGVLVGAILFAFYVSRLLQRQVSGPILHLAETARLVSEGRDYSVRAQPGGDDEVGQVTEAFNTMLSQVQQSHAALAQKEAQMRVMTDNAAVFLCQIDREHRFVFVNRAYARRYGLEPSDIIGRPLSDLLGQEAYGMIRDRIDKTLSGERDECELELPYTTLGRRWIHQVYEPLRDEGGATVGVVAVLGDVTEAKLAALEVARARDEALQASRAKDDFLAALSHELRTPLNPVLLLASDAATNPHLPPQVRGDFETVRRNIELEARLIDDLLDLTRIAKGKLVLREELIDADETLEEALSNAKADFTERGISLTMRPSGARPLVKADPVRLQQVFWNVLKNAAKFTPAGGSVAVSSEVNPESRVLTVTITDTGIGISSTDLPHVFETFSQGEHARGTGQHRYGGLGLGLAISRSIVEMHGGTIRAESAGRNMGSRFIIGLPLAGETSLRPEGRPSPVVSSDPTPAHRGALLLVEDHAATRLVLERLLRKRGYAVTSAGSVAEARAHARAQRFDILLSDIGLPDGNGFELMAELGTRQPLVGIALTGYGAETDHARSRIAGFLTHLTKPISSQALDQALAFAVAARGSSTPPPL